MAILIPAAYVVDTGLHKSRHFYYAEWNDLFNGKINADMLIMGTSRAWVHFSPGMIDSELHVNSYNLGMDAAPFSLQYERLKMYMRYNKKPKYIVQEVGFNTTLVLSKDLPLYQQFLPYLNDSTMWRIYKNEYDNVTLVDKYFPLYKYNNMLPVLKEGIQSYMGKGRVSVKYKGYQGQERAWDNSFEQFVADNKNGIRWKISKEAVALFNDYIQFCKRNDIQLIMVYAPFYYEMDKYILNHDTIRSVLESFATDNGIPYLDYTHNYLDSNRAYFYNSQHLNKKGSELLTAMLIKDIRPIVRPATKRDTTTDLPR